MGNQSLGPPGLKKWVDEFAPEAVVYMVGESVFLDKLVLKTCRRCAVPLVLYNGEEPIGLTMGSRLSETVFDVHFEKALGTVQGDYTILNRSFARHIREKYPEVRWLNREDDMGLPGLRKAKESYHPHHMVEQYRCFAREDLL